jgi:anti-sigma-K factor RskA
MPDAGRLLREALLAASPTSLVLPWQTTEDAAAVGASGDMLWSADAQRGVMRISGLAANDPSRLQYQLWIFDATRDERSPVDGGVFDVPAGVSEVLVPVQPRVPVGDATLFAVTVERPGGVVVSDRERIVLLAQRD